MIENNIIRMENIISGLVVKFRKRILLEWRIMLPGCFLSGWEKNIIGMENNVPGNGCQMPRKECYWKILYHWNGQRNVNGKKLLNY